MDTMSKFTHLKTLPPVKTLWRFAKKKKVSLPFFIFSFSFFVLIYIYWGLPFPTQLTSEARNPVSTQLLDRNGRLIYEIFEEKRRTPINIQELPPYVAQATIAIEDKDFYKHHGLSLTGIGRAFLKTTTQGELQGGSTITQQLVKTTLLSPERTVKRKIRELTLTLIIETLYPKDKILEMYLNNVPYGGTAWGIESAAHTYFGKNAKDLSLPEAAIIAGLPAAPTRFSPLGAHPELALDRQKLVLKRMVEDGYISQEEAERAENKQLSFIKQDNIKAPHFALWVKEQLVEKYGEHQVERGGLRVKTTLDLELQDFAQQTIATEVGKLKKENVGNGAAIITNPKTGEIYAMIGSKDYFAQDEDGKVNIVLSKRQPGSSIKPLNYALALSNGNITPATPLADVPSCFTNPGQPLYCPVNYNHSFNGAVQARFALGNSLNIPAVRVLALNGVSEFVDFARKMGISTFEDPSKYGLSLTLGGGEVKMIDMAKAFGAFANGGLRQEPVSILEVKDWQGSVFEENQIKEGDRVLPMEVSYLISHVLLDNNARSATFGTTSYLIVGNHPEVSVKTGTTQNLRDNWTIGYSPEVVVATWVGNNDNEEMSRIASGVTGAAPIWNKLIKRALDRIEAGELGGTGEQLNKHAHIWPNKPGSVIGTNVCATTGSLPPGGSLNPEDPNQPTDPGCPIRFEFFLQDFPPKTSEPLTRQVSVFKDSQMLSPENAAPEEIEIKDHQVFLDPLGTPVCLDCPTPNWPVTINPANVIQQTTTFVSTPSPTSFQQGKIEE
ncbi:MAG TPA: penicillin-binding protein [Candidatus Blackburnbacteria bacterium]|nr:penicillin-binding protein [Candidatus Blackburnbacteria bacterium]